LLTNEQSTYYIVYDEHSILTLTDFQEVCDCLAEGAVLYGYATDEDMLRRLVAECYYRSTQQH